MITIPEAITPNMEATDNIMTNMGARNIMVNITRAVGSRRVTGSTGITRRVITMTNIRVTRANMANMEVMAIPNIMAKRVSVMNTLCFWHPKYTALSETVYTDGENLQFMAYAGNSAPKKANST